MDWARGVVLQAGGEEWRGRSYGVRGSAFQGPDAVGLLQKIEVIAYVVCGVKGEGPRLLVAVRLWVVSEISSSFGTCFGDARLGV